MDLRDAVADRLESACATMIESLVLTDKTHEEYLLLVGKIRGLKLAIELMQDVYSEYINS